MGDTVRILPSRIAGTLQAPPSKSMAHRLLFCAALAAGTSHIENIAWSEDIAATAGALQALGAQPGASQAAAPGSAPAEAPPSSETLPTGNTLALRGFGGKPRRPQAPIDCNESGSTLRFLIPLGSLAGGPVHFTGAARLFARPLGAYEHIFREQGLYFAQSPGGLCVEGPLRPGRYALAGNVSSQFVSGLLFCLPLLDGDSEIALSPPVESRSYIALTRAAQAAYGVTSSWLDENTLAVPGGQRYRAANTAVEGDWSQAAVAAVLGAVCGPNTPGVRIGGLNPASQQGDKAILPIVKQAGADAAYTDDGVLHVAPPFATHGVRQPNAPGTALSGSVASGAAGCGSAGLTSPGTIDLADCPDLGPILCTLALFCSGTTRLVNAGRLRLKESDRIAAMQQELQKLGANISATQDTVTIVGTGGMLRAGQTVEGHNDHRIVMALSAAALGAGVPLTIQGAGAVAKSWPTFFDDLQTLGAKVAFT